MAIEVLLMADVADVGAEGDVVSVADGFARNYLFPSKRAAPVTQATRKRLEKMRRDRDAAKAAELAGARGVAAKLAAASCTIAVKVGKDEKMYGSVTAADIAAALKAQGIELDKQHLVLDEPIRELGVFDVKVKLHAEVEGTVKVWVVEE
jgi:large subunit ribosomal protein L9